MPGGARERARLVDAPGTKCAIESYCLVCVAANSKRISAVQNKMAEEGSTASYLSVTTITTGMTQITGGYTVTPSSPRGIVFYFQIAVLVIGVVGTAANALILYALVASKEHKTHVLIVHQNALDLFASFFMIVSHTTRLCNIHLTGSVGYWLCTIILTESFSWWGTGASAINLASITVERYLKVVYPVWSKNKLHNWMIYSAMVTAWITSFIALSLIHI